VEETMMYIKTYIGSKNVRKALYGAFLIVVIVSLFAMLRNKESLLSNCLYNDKITLNSERELDLSFDSWSGVQLMEYLKWPDHPKACERVGYFGGKILKNSHEAFMDGQKAVCLDNGTVPALENCIIYSIGINDEWDFDEAMEAYGCQVA